MMDVTASVCSDTVYISKCLTSFTSSFLTRHLNISVVYLGMARSASHNVLHSSSIIIISCLGNFDSKSRPIIKVN